MTFVSCVLLSVLGYFTVAVLAVTPKTHALRVALWPIITLFALGAAIPVDTLASEPDQESSNIFFVVVTFFIITRTFDWTLTKEPLARCPPPAKGSQSTIMGALDLATSFRGYGWNWSRGVYIPPETRPTDRRGFTSHVILSATFYSSLCGIFYRAIWSFSPTGLGGPSGGSIFDDALPFHVRYLRASVITFFAAVAIYAAIQTCYDTCTIVAVLVFRQDPIRWPPAFDAPWRATSLRDFWGRRWHQFMRHTFLMYGGYPLSYFLGMPGLLIGTFLASGAYHHLGMAQLNNELELWRMLVGFGMMAPGIMAEWAFKRFTGRKVGGAAGWVWTMAWLLFWGNVIVDGFARGGLFGHFTFIGCLAPGREVVQRLVADFDAWLHAL